MYVLCVCPRPTKPQKGTRSQTPESHVAVSHLVGAGAGTWPQEEQQTLLTAELPLQPHGSSCDANMKEQYWLLPASISNPYGTLYTMNGPYGCFCFNIYYLFGKYWFNKLHRLLNYIMLKKHFISLVLEVSILRNSEA